MPDLLLELRSEEIPARMQRKAAGDLKKMITDGLVEAGLTYEGAQEYWTPRRLTLDIRGLTARSRDVSDEIKGPSVSAPDAAIQGFLRKAGLSDISQAHKHADPKKGEFYVAHVVKPGRAAEEIIAALVPQVVRSFPWPKEMRWGAASGPKGARYGKTEGQGGNALRWVRPLQSIVCTFGPETEEPVVVDFEIDGIRSGNVTYGHRFHAPEAITVRRFEDYAAKLEAARVVLDAERRKRIILDDAKNIVFANGLELVEDEGLLEEVAGLVEWPVVVMGEFEKEFLAIPAEVIRLTIRANQKCFVTAPTSPSRGEVAPQGAGGGVRDGHPTPALRSDPPPQGEGKLSNRFILTANIEAKDGGKEIAHGNGKVVRARLSDALYFWKTDQGDLPDLAQLKDSAAKFGLDLAKPLDQRMARLDHLNVTFHAKLGTQGERVQRIAALAREIAPIVGADPDLAARAAVLAKADLTTEVVGEFPELQGAMGRKYALLQGEDTSVAAAIEEHYKPQGPSDRVPNDPVSIAVALADKLDTLTGFWAIDEKPTGSKDPYALRRAALGVIRIVLENGVRLPLLAVLLRTFPSIYQRTDLAFKLLIRNLEGYFEYPQFWRDISWPFITDDGDELWPVEHFLFGYDQEVWVFDKPLLPPSNPHELPEDLRFQGLSVKGEPVFDRREELEAHSYKLVSAKVAVADLLSFFHDRLKVYLRDQGARHDLIDAVLASGTPTSPLRGGRSVAAGGGAKGDHPTPALRADPPPEGEGGSQNDDLLTIVRRVEALGSFLASEDGRNLLAGTKRAANILAAEEKKGTAIAASVDPARFSTVQEKTLFAALNQAEKEAGEAIQKEDFSAAMRALSALREPVDSFFEGVLVNDEDQAVRANRLALLARIRGATGEVADFSKIAG